MERVGLACLQLAAEVMGGAIAGPLIHYLSVLIQDLDCRAFDFLAGCCVYLADQNFQTIIKVKPSNLIANVCLRCNVFLISILCRYR